jgi:hypothetical protein
VSEVKEEIKRRLAKFWLEHPDFDGRNPKHAHEFWIFLNELVALARDDHRVVAEAIKELRMGAERAAKEAREKFYRAVLGVKEK